MKDWSALEDAARAVRRLNRAVARYDVTDDDWRAVTRDADALADRLESGQERSKEHDVMTVPALATFYEGGAMDVAIGEVVEFDPFSAGGGRLHPASVGMALRREADAAVSAVVRIDPMFEGPPGRAHGGVLALLFDELMSSVNRIAGRRAFTARLTVDLRAPAPIDEELTFRAWLQDQQERKITVRAEGHHGDVLVVEAEGLFVLRRPS